MDLYNFEQFINYCYYYNDQERIVADFVDCC